MDGSSATESPASLRSLSPSRDGAEDRKNLELVMVGVSESFRISIDSHHARGKQRKVQGPMIGKGHWFITETDRDGEASEEDEDTATGQWGTGSCLQAS